MSQEPIGLQDTILRVLERNRLAVLATQRDGQPHASEEEEAMRWKDEAKFRSRRAIELCRDGVNDTLQELSVRRFQRDICDKMALDFEERFGQKP